MCAPTRNDMQLLGPVGPRDHEVFSDGGLGILRMLHDRFDGRRRELLRLRRDRDLAAGPGGRRSRPGGPAGRDHRAGRPQDDDHSKRYVLEDGPLATIIVRPRGLHLDEEHLRIKGAPIAGALFDFGLYVHHNARRLIEQGTGPYFYLPKLESHLEARWWDDVFTRTEQWLRIPHGTIRATVLIETLPAAFEMEEILYELRDHAAGLNAGRWDYIFSTIKNLGADPAYVLPDRADVTMTVPFMRAYTELLVKTCHRRGAHAIGGMSAVIPSRDEDRNRDALAKVRADKEREAAAGYDGSWVAHPGLVATCRDAFTVVRYVDAWLDGRGAVGLDGLMEDAATAEISRCQLWQWCRHATPIDGGGVVTRFRVAALLEQELDALEQAGRPPERIEALRHVVRRGALGDDLPAFLTDDAYRRFLVTREEAAA